VPAGVLGKNSDYVKEFPKRNTQGHVREEEGAERRMTNSENRRIKGSASQWEHQVRLDYPNSKVHRTILLSLYTYSLSSMSRSHVSQDDASPSCESSWEATPIRLRIAIG
jgi:hypothetical protein